MSSPFNQAAEKIRDIAVEAVKLELAAQGHTLTGALIDSVRGVITTTTTGAMIEGVWLSYGGPVNTGVPASNIPYTRGSRSGGGSSAYIAGLTLFAKLRFRATDKEATRIAFAIANKHKQQGMPTQASKRFSKTGKRTGAVQDALEKVNPQIQQIINEVITYYVNDLIVTTFKTNIPDVKVQ